MQPSSGPTAQPEPDEQAWVSPVTGGAFSVGRAVVAVCVLSLAALDTLGAPPALAGLYDSGVPGAAMMAALSVLAGLLGVGVATRPVALWLLIWAAWRALVVVEGGELGWAPHGFALTLPAALLALASAPDGRAGSVAPFGSWPARGRPDPDGGWRWTEPLTRVLPLFGALVAGILLVLGLLALRGSGASALRGDELPAMLALIAAAHPWARLGGVSLSAPAGAGAAADETNRAPGALLFYDGSCGLCHRTVRFVLAEDRDQRFRVAALGTPAFEAVVAEAERGSLPDSVVVWTPARGLQVRSDAVITLLAGLGGLWRVVGRAVSWIPRPVRDTAYDGVAAIRHRLFAKPMEACPLMPPDVAQRFVYELEPSHD